MSIALIFLLCLKIASSPTNWQNIHSDLGFEKIIFNQDNIYAQNNGVLTEFNTILRKFNIPNIDNIDCNISDFEIINDDFWILCENGTLRNHSDNLVLNHLILDSAYHINFYNNSVFMLYEKNEVHGVIEISYSNDQLTYQDYYDGFASFGTTFSKSIVFQNKIYIQSNNGLYVGNLDQNLKNNSSWTKYFDSTSLLDVIVFNGQLFAICEDGIRIMDENYAFNANPDIQVPAIDFIDSFNYNDFELYILHGSGILKINQNHQFSSEYELSLSKASSILVKEDIIYLSHIDQGLWILNTNIQKCSPNTLLSSNIESLTFNDGILYGVSRKGAFSYDGSIFENFLSNNFDSSFYIVNTDCNNFNATQLDYVPGSKISSGLVAHNNTLFIPNSGILPDEDNKGGLILIDPVAKDLIDIISSDQLEGLDGIYYNDLSNGYLTINQVLKDDYNNIWIVNPYSETERKILKYFNTSDFTWNSITAQDNISYLPQEISFDQWGRIWIGFRNESTIDGNLYSSGGIKLVTLDGNWINIENLDSLPGDDRNVNVWSLDFGKFENKDILWILTSNGVQGYSITGNRIDPVYPIDFFTNIPFQKGDKIRVDPSNNVWIITNHSGLRVIKNDLSFWPSQDGITAQNSDLKTDNLTDVAFDYENGRVFLSSEKGLSVFDVPFSNNPISERIRISPNPFILNEHSLLEIDNISYGTEVVVMTIDGRVLKKNQIPYNENKVTFTDLSNFDTGIYFIVVKNEHSKTNVAKLAIIK